MEMIQQQIISHGQSPDLALQEQTLVDHILESQKQEKILWMKKSRVKWLKEGEHNTKFFHCSMIQRRHSNRITIRISEKGNKITSHSNIEQELTTLFQNILVEPLLDRSESIQAIVQKIPHLVTDEQNTNLMRLISLEEVETSNFSLAIRKALGLDGFT